MTVDWHQQYVFTNDPPINLGFHPETDACMYTSGPTGDGGVVFHLDMTTGQSQVIDGIADTLGLAFEPASNRLYTVIPNYSGPGGWLWEAGFGKHGFLGGNKQIGAFPFAPFSVSLAFVLHVERDWTMLVKLRVFAGMSIDDRGSSIGT